MAKISFPLQTNLLLAGILVFAGISGYFMFQTGEEVANNPVMQMISHTEYRFGEPGQIIARLVNFQGAAVTVNSCNATILYPDKSFFVNSAGMTASGNISGDHYYSFTTPAGPEGVYEYQATCYYDQGATTKNASVTNSFHLSGAFNSVLGNLTDIQGDLSSINTSLSDLTVNLSGVEGGISDLNSSLSIVLSNQNIINATLNQVNLTLTDMQGVLNNVNVTTTNTYQYLTGTVTTNLNQILSDLGVINATVNRIEITTNTINGTVTTIQTNQENQVFMTTFSG